MRLARGAAYFYIGLGLAAIAWGGWAGFYLASAGFVVWAMNRREA